MNNVQTLDLSWKTITKIVITFAVAYLLFAIQEIVIMTIFALVLAILLRSGIDSVSRKWIPRWVASTIVYVFIFGSVGMLIYFSAPIIAEEVHSILPNLSHYLEEAAPILEKLDLASWKNLQSVDEALSSFVKTTSQGILNSLSTIFGSIASMIFVLTLGIFISLEKRGVDDLISLLAPERYTDRVHKAWRRSRREISHWFNSRIICSLFIGAAYFVVYQLFGVRAALILALLAFFLNFIPYIGALTANLLGAFVVGIESSWVAALLVLVILILIQQIEAYIVFPMLTKKFTGLPPYLVLLSVAIGGSLFGVIGAILAIPITAIIYRFIVDLKSGEYLEEEVE